MTTRTRAVAYSDDGIEFEGFLAAPRDFARGPVVMVSHAWAGLGDFERGVAEKIASLGYAAFALDLYGKGKRGATTEECEALMTPFMKQRGMLRQRLLKNVDVAKSLPEADPSKVAAIGFCFGGLCALDIARAGADVRGAASFHGLFAPTGFPNERIKAKILAMHGWDDPMVPPDAVTALARELTESGADWQVHAYGGTMHAFTNPQANDPSFGTVYSEKAARRSFTALEDFLRECFA